MRNSFFALSIFFASFGVLALEGVGLFEQRLLDKNQKYISLQDAVDSRKEIFEASKSGFYPTLNAVTGWGQNNSKDLSTTEKGYLGYLEGKINLFRGFKDQVLMNQSNVNIALAQIDLEVSKRELRLQLTEAFGNMILLHKLQFILDEEYKVTQTQKKMAARKVAAGLTGAVDDLEFDLRESEIQIEQKQIYQKHQEAHQVLKNLFGNDVSDLELEKLEFSNFDKLAKEQNQNQIKIENSMEYKKANLLQIKSELEQKDARADFFPSLDFTYSVGSLTPWNDSSMKFNETRYALLFTIPLFSGFDSYSKVKAATFLKSAADKAKKQKETDINTELEILKINSAELIDLFKINENKLVLLKKYFDLTLSEYKRGVKNSPDLVSATERLFFAKKKKFEILKDLEVLKVKLENLN